MAYVYYNRPGIPQNVDIKAQALNLTWNSLVLAAIINLLFIILPIPPIIYLLAFIAEFGIIISMWFFMPKTESGRKNLLYAFVITTAITLSLTLELTLTVYSNGFIIVTAAFGLTSVVAGIMYYIAATKTPNLSFMNKYLFFGLIGLIILSVLGIFIAFGTLFDLLISIFGAVLFSIWLLVDLSRLERKEFYSPALMALSLYWDLLLIFRYLLRILIILLGDRD